MENLRILTMILIKVNGKMTKQMAGEPLLALKMLNSNKHLLNWEGSLKMINRTDLVA